MPIETLPAPTNQVLDNLDRRSKPRPFFEAQIEQLAAQIEKKQSERNSPVVESPFFPGIMFRKNGRLQRIERENAEPWENIVDYLNRRYRIEQISQKRLMAELRMTALTIRTTLLSIGIPKLHSSEYKDPTARAMAARWEDAEARSGRTQGMRLDWQENKEVRLARVQSAQARASRSRAHIQLHIDNPDTKNKAIAAAQEGKQASLQARMKEVLGEDPIARMRELFVDRGLGKTAAARELGDKVNSATLYQWAVEQGVIERNKKGVERKHGTTADRASETKTLEEDRELWTELPDRQREAIQLLFDENGKVRKLDVIGEQLGVSKAAVSLLLIRAKSNLEKIKRGEPLSKAGRPRKITSQE